MTARMTTKQLVEHVAAMTMDRSEPPHPEAMKLDGGLRADWEEALEKAQSIVDVVWLARDFGPEATFEDVLDEAGARYTERMREQREQAEPQTRTMPEWINDDWLDGTLKPLKDKLEGTSFAEVGVALDRLLRSGKKGRG